MKCYLLWVSRKGCKDLVAVFGSRKTAIELRDEMMKWCPKYGQRVYITIAIDGAMYNHVEMED